MSIYNSDQNLWMQKYRYTLQRLEQEEKEWRKKEGILKLISTWLILAADQRDPLLNNDMQELRSLLRNSQDSSTLQSMTERLGVSVTRLNKKRKEISEGGDFVDLFVKVLDVLRRKTQPIPDKQYLTETLVTAQRREGQDGLVESFAELIEKYLHSQPEADQEKHHNATKLEIASDPIPESTPKLHEVLIELLHKLDFPQPIRAQVNVIIVRMSQGIRFDQVSLYIAEIVDLVLQTRLQLQAEKQELERFLANLSEQLSDIDDYLVAQGVSEQQTLEMRNNLSERLNGEVSVIETTLHGAADLETVKSAIQIRLNAIHAHLDEGHRFEIERAQKAESEIQLLQTKLKATEDVMAGLRERLIQEREQAIKDPLTGLYNRIAFEERFQHEVKRWERYGSPLSLIILDIDHFKNVNDSYGHKTGDRLLKFLADVLQNQLRETDMLVRFGGEEFVVLSLDTDAENALTLAEKLRQTVHRCRFHFADERIPLSISCGVSSLKAGDTAESLFERADQALYSAKAEGRNLCKAA